MGSTYRVHSRARCQLGSAQNLCFTDHQAAKRLTFLNSIVVAASIPKSPTYRASLPAKSAGTMCICCAGESIVCGHIRCGVQQLDLVCIATLLSQGPTMSASASPGSFLAKNSGVLQPQHHRQDTLCWNSVLPAPHRTIHGHDRSSALQAAGALCNRCSHTAQTVLNSSSPGEVQRQLDAIQRQRHCPAAILPHQPRCCAHHRIQHAPCRREDPVWRRPGRLFETPVPANATDGGHSLMSWCWEWCLQPACSREFGLAKP